MRRKDIKPLPSQAELCRLFTYKPDTGILSWQVVSGITRNDIARNNRVGGKTAGTVTKRGYLHVAIRTDDKFTVYLAHRIIWKLVTGQEPADQIDHVDGDRLNNRWSNLRQADNQKNLWNSKLRRDNKTGVKGVTTRHGKYRVAIKENGHILCLGTFSSLEEAAAVRAKAASKMHGDFVRLR